MVDIERARTDREFARSLQIEFRRAVGMISGRWKLEILWLLSQGTHRFGELKRGLPGITQHMLTAQLRALEKRRADQAHDLRRGAAAGGIRESPPTPAACGRSSSKS